jgi:cell division protein FtsB
MLIKAGTVIFSLATLGMIILTLVSDRGLFEVRRKAARLTDIEQQITDIEAENAALIEEIRTLRHDPAEIERRAREELKLVRPGEVILIVPGADD